MKNPFQWKRIDLYQLIPLLQKPEKCCMTSIQKVSFPIGENLECRWIWSSKFQCWFRSVKAMKVLTKAVRHPIPDPMKKEPKKTRKKLPNDFNIDLLSNCCTIAVETYFSIELNISHIHPIIPNLLSYLARTKQTASFNTLSPKMIA